MSSLGSGGREPGSADFFGNQRFELEETLGEGAFGVVYQAFDRLRETRVALKVMRRLGPDALFYFKREFRALSDIRHPNLVHYYDLFEDQGRWFLTMELARGPSIVEHVRGARDPMSSGARFEESRLRASLVQLVAAVDALHRAGKVHRDVKPSNVRVVDGFRVVLLDFGLVLDTETRESTRLPRVGTAAYMAPEQVLGSDVGPLADYYALGCILYECLTGRHPYVGDPYEILAAKQDHDPPRPSAIAPCVPPDMEELCLSLLARDPNERAVGVDVLRELLPQKRLSTFPRAPHTATRVGFVGRARELIALLRLLDPIDSPALRVAVVYGESGLGKSALLAELTRRIRSVRSDALVIGGRCYEREAVPFKAFDGVIDALARALKRLPEERVAGLLPPNAGLLQQVFPVLGRVPEIAQRAQSEPLRADAPLLRRRAFGALKALLARLGEEQLVVILIDDMHWADPDSISLLDEILTPPPASNLLFVFSSRARGARDDQQSFEAVIARANPLRLRLAALSQTDARDLAESMLVRLGGDRAHAEAIAQEAAGQPLFVSALSHYAASRGGTAIPVLDEALAVSIDALTPAARSLLAMLAVAGAPLSWEVLGRAAQLSPATLSLAAEELRATPWVRSHQEAGLSSVEFAHDRVGRLVLSRVSERERRAMHGRLGDALSRTGADPEAVVLHWIEAGQTERVTRHALRAADAAVDSLAFARAVRLYEVAREHCPAEEVTLRREIGIALAQALSLSGRAEQAAQLYLDLSADTDPDTSLELRQRAAEQWLASSDHARGVREIEALLVALGETPEASRSQLVWSLRARQAFSWLRGERFELRSWTQVSPQERVRVDLLHDLVLATSATDPLRCAALQVRHLDAALQAGEPLRLSRAHALQAWLVRAGFHGEPLSSSREMLRAKELSRLADHPHASALVQLVEAVAAHAEGRQREGFEAAERALRTLREDCRGAAWEITQALLVRLACLRDAGRFLELVPAAREAQDELEQRGNPLDAYLFASRIGYFTQLLGDEPDAARMTLERVRDETKCFPHAIYALDVLRGQVDLDLYVGDPNAHARVERALRAITGAHLLRSSLALPMAAELRVRAALGSAYLLPHERPRLLDLARRALELLTRFEAEHVQARALLLSGGIEEVLSERARAIHLFGQAVVACDAASMPHLAAVARRRQGQLLGTEEGLSMVLRAERWLREQGAVDPGRFAALLLGY